MATHFVFKNLFKSGYSKLNTLPTSSTTTVTTMPPCLTRPTRQRCALHSFLKTWKQPMSWANDWWKRRRPMRNRTDSYRGCAFLRYWIGVSPVWDLKYRIPKIRNCMISLLNWRKVSYFNLRWVMRPPNSCLLHTKSPYPTRQQGAQVLSTNESPPSAKII